jgi:hypothetical protein
MPIDYNYQFTPNFRDLTPTGLVLLQKPLVRSLAKLERLRRGVVGAEAPLVLKTARHFRRSPLPGSLY